MDNYFTIRGVDPALRRAFKIACIKEGMTIKEAITKLMEAFIAKIEGGAK